MRIFLLVTISFLTMSAPLFAQIVLDDFNDGVTTGWTPANDGSNVSTLTEANGEMRIDYNNTAPNMFPRSVFEIQGGPVDMSQFSILRVAVRTFNSSGTVNLRLDLMDTTTYTTNSDPFLVEPLLTDGNYKVFEFDFTGKWISSFWNGMSGFWLVDPTVIENIEVFVCYDNATAGQDSIWLDYIEIDTASIFCQNTVASNDTLDDMDCQQNINYTFANSGWQVIANPDMSGLNQSSFCGEFYRWPAPSDGAFGGPLNLAPLDFTTNNQMRMHFWNDNDPVDVLVILQNSALGDLAVETATSLGLGEWELLTFDFSQITDSTDISNIVMLVGPGDPNSFDSTYYIDNIVLDGFRNYPCDNAQTDIQIFDDAECQQNINYVFANAGWARVNNPDQSGSNTSSHARKYVRFDGQDGAVGGPFNNAPVDLDDISEITMDFWNNTADVGVVMILQDGVGVDLDAQVQIAPATGQWETLTFDFSAAASSNDIQSIVLVVGDSTYTGITYFVDNIRLKTVASINDLTNQYQLEIFPNPFSEQTSVSFTLENSDELTVHMTAVDGKRVKTIYNEEQFPAGNNIINIQTQDLPDGIYFLEIISEEGKAVKKLIKTK